MQGANVGQVLLVVAVWPGRAVELSVAPGSMGRAEPAGESGAHIRALIESSGTGRNGAPNDIAEATALLLSPAASFITGTDLLVDGGVIAATRSAAAPG
ncbi:SDR family oxidoreductase [Streptomyces sp. NPDC059506]|uniref:SDR family oxidoreductase n=1 Tax=Streptomyces sp. NPDC059506 TaxID=3347751 RepID=UPI00367EF3BA